MILCDEWSPAQMKAFRLMANRSVAWTAWDEELLAIELQELNALDFRRIMETHAADILQPDIGNTGGIMETKKIAAMAETYNMRIQPHNCSSPVCTAASLQLDATIANFYIQEVYPYRVPEHFAI